MARVEFKGRDLEEAIAQAAAALGLPPEKVKFSVLSMGTRGFLGLGRRQARIAVDPDDPALDVDDRAAPHPKGDTPPPRPGRVSADGQSPPPGSSRRAETDEPSPRPPAAPVAEETAPSGGPSESCPFNVASSERRPRPAGTPLEKKPADRPTRRARAPKEPNVAPSGPARKNDGGEAAAPARRPEPAPSRQKGPPRERNRPAGPEPAALDWAHVPPPLTRPGPGEVPLEGPPDPAAELAAAVLSEILGRMGFAATVSVARIGSRVVLSLDSEDNALLIGTRGTTLEALQFLTGKIVARRLRVAEAGAAQDDRAPSGPEDAVTDGNGEGPDESAAAGGFRVVVDAADYRFRRQNHLLETLKSLAGQVRQTGQPQTLPGLNSAERRLVQLALRPFKDLAVEAAGGREALVIAPAAAPRPRRPRRPGRPQD